MLALERALHRIAEAMLDICRHLVAVHSLGIVESYGEYSRRLAQAGKMPRGLAIVFKIAPNFIQWVKSIDA